MDLIAGGKKGGEDMDRQTRAFEGPQDLQAMIALMDELRGRQRVYPIAADLYEELSEPEAQTAARLWLAGGRMLGFATINRYQNLVDVFRQDDFTLALQAEMMDWLEQAARNQSLTALDASTLEDDAPRRAFLERFGFALLEESSLLYARRLTDDLPAAPLPPGFVIRPLGGMAELEAYAALHRAAFDSQTMTSAYRQTIMSAPDYIAELDLVAVAPGGELAAFCMGQIFADDAPRAGGQREGWSDPLGTHPAYRRQGLAHALIVEVMRRLSARGMDTALLGTRSTNTAMRRTAESLGFGVASNTLWYSKALK